MDLAQIATLIGVAVGSAFSAYQAAKRRVNRDQYAQFEALRKKVLKIEERRPQTLSDERVREIIELALREYVTEEEFRAYAVLDSEKREDLIQGIGKLQGSVEALLRRR